MSKRVKPFNLQYRRALNGFENNGLGMGFKGVNNGYTLHPLILSFQISLLCNFLNYQLLSSGNYELAVFEDGRQLAAWQTGGAAKRSCCRCVRTCWRRENKEFLKIE